MKLKPLKNKKHLHKYDKIVEWVTEPKHPDDIGSYWEFAVIRSCECGVTKEGEAERNEIEDFIKTATCNSCGSMRSKHTTQTDCILELQNRVRFMEDRLSNVCESLNGVGRRTSYGW